MPPILKIFLFVLGIAGFFTIGYKMGPVIDKIIGREKMLNDLKKERITKILQHIEKLQEERLVNNIKINVLNETLHTAWPDQFLPLSLLIEAMIKNEGINNELDLNEATLESLEEKK